MSNPLSDFHEGDLFRYAHRVCTIVKEGDMTLVKSLSDGWVGRIEWQEGKDYVAEKIDMPKTPLELLNFIREYQYYEDWEDIAP